MGKNTYEHEGLDKLPAFVRAKEIIRDPECCWIDEVLTLLDDLSIYEKEFKDIQQRLFEVTYNNIVYTLLEPLNKLFEEEYEKKGNNVN